MPNGTEIDGIYVALDTDFKKALQNFDAANKETDNLQSNLESLDKETKKTAAQMDSMGSSVKSAAKKADGLTDSIEDVSKQTQKSTTQFKSSDTAIDRLCDSVDELTKALKKEKDASKDVEKQHKKTADETENLKKKTDESSDSVFDLRKSMDDAKVSGSLSVAALAGAVVGAMATISAKAVEASTAFQEMEGAIRISTGASGDMLEDLSKLASELYIGNPIETTDAGALVSDLSVLWGVEGDELKELSQSYLEFSKISGMEVKDAITGLRPVFKKWNVDVQSQADVMDSLFRVTKSYKITMPELLDLLSAGDKGFQLMGMTIEEAATAMGMLATNDDLGTASEFANTLERVLTKVISDANSDYENAITEVDKAADAISKATTAYQKAKDAYEKALKEGSETQIESAQQTLADAAAAINDAQYAKTLAEKARDDAASALTADMSYQKFTEILSVIKSAGNEDDATINATPFIGAGMANRISKAYYGGMQGYEDATANLNGEGVHEAYEATKTLDDKFTELSNTINNSLVPAGDVLAGIIDDITKNVDGLSSAVTIFSNLITGWFGTLIGDKNAVDTSGQNIMGAVGITRPEDDVGGAIYDVVSGPATTLGFDIMKNPSLMLPNFGKFIVSSIQNTISEVDEIKQVAPTVVNVTQNITSPTPTDAWTISNAAERGVKIGARTYH